MDKFDQLRAITRRALDEKEGCEWVKSKSIQDIGNYTLEETYELLDALENKSIPEVVDELADLAFHLALYTEIGEKQGDFDLDEVLEKAINKQRHRRLSLDQPGVSADEAHAYWKEQKQKIRSEEGLLDDIPNNMPALMRSQKIQDRVGDVGFDWDNIGQIISKIKEEIDEFEVELESEDREGMQDELGDIFFTVVNMARHLNIDAEQALRYANRKFMRRFYQVEKRVAEDGQLIESMDFKALLEVWEQVKSKEK